MKARYLLKGFVERDDFFEAALIRRDAPYGHPDGTDPEKATAKMPDKEGSGAFLVQALGAF